MAKRKYPTRPNRTGRQTTGTDTETTLDPPRKAHSGGRAVPGKAPRGPVLSPDESKLTDLGRFVLDQLDRGVVLLDDRGRVLDANTIAIAILQAGDALSIRGGRLTFADPDLDSRWHRVLALGRDGDTAPSMAARIRRTDGSPCHLVISPVGPDLGAHLVSYVVLMFLPNGRREISPAVLRDLFGLTRAQAAVACSLYEGRSVEATAAKLGLSLNTVRSHLKQVFSKCEVQSQAELLHLLASGPHDC
jgi:DNA-binding CsgD family transcriptional regulator